MAQVLGTSGAWKQVVDSVDKLGLSCSCPSDIKTARDGLIASEAERIAQAAAEVDKSIATLEAQLPQVMEDSESRIHAALTRLAVQRAEIDARIAQLLAQPRLLRWLVNGFRIWSAKRLKVKAEANHVKLMASERQRVSDYRRWVDQARSSKAQTVSRRVREIKQTITDLDAVLKSHDFRGALAELEVAKALAKLPDKCCVFHDVRLVADRFIRFAGVPLQSAQADHVVLTSGSVFVIEAKNWSREFVSEGNYFDPYVQVGRARFLCQVLLKDRGCSPKVRSIIATRGQLPAKRPDQYVKVLRPEQLAGYITWFKDPVLAPYEFDCVRAYLTQMSTEPAGGFPL